MNNLKEAWEKRASEHGSSLEGVLYRGFGPDLNRYIHQWHIWVVENRLLGLLPTNARILDIGCGYGRIREGILKVRPDLQIFGVDFSENYCRLHNKKMKAETVCADINNLPFEKAAFDGIVGVTSLMYIESSSPKWIIAREVLAAIKPGGFGLFIDPGFELMQVARLLKPSSGKTPTKGIGFLVKNYQTLGEFGDCITVAGGAIPLFTIILPFLMICRFIPALANLFLNIIRPVDYPSTVFQKYSLQRWVLLQKSAQPKYSL